VVIDNRARGPSLRAQQAPDEGEPPLDRWDRTALLPGNFAVGVPLQFPHRDGAQARVREPAEQVFDLFREDGRFRR
jgi:hypothetical protein